MNDPVELKDLATRSYEAVGSCIYCGETTDLTDEHILPFGLSGPAVLPKSSCKPCARITGRVEGIVLRGPMRALRVLRKLTSRSKHKGFPKDFPLIVVRDGVEEEVRVTLEEHPIPLAFPVFGVPGLISPADYTEGIRLRGIAGIQFGRHPDEVLKALDADDYRITQNYRPVEFARVLAKIAYSFAVAEDFLSLREGVHPITSAILGKTDDIGAYIGTFTDPLGRQPGLQHSIKLKKNEERGWRLASIKLFADDPTPEYGVIFDVTT